MKAAALIVVLALTGSCNARVSSDMFDMRTASFAVTKLETLDELLWIKVVNGLIVDYGTASGDSPQCYLKARYAIDPGPGAGLRFIDAQCQFPCASACYLCEEDFEGGYYLWCKCASVGPCGVFPF